MCLVEAQVVLLCREAAGQIGDGWSVKMSCMKKNVLHVRLWRVAFGIGITFGSELISRWGGLEDKTVDLDHYNRPTCPVTS